MKLKDFIVPKVLENTDHKNRHGNTSFNTTELVYIEQDLDIQNMRFNEKTVYPTDYTIMNSANMSIYNMQPLDRQSCLIWLRSSSKTYQIDICDYNGDVYFYDFDLKEVAIRPALCLDLQKVIQANTLTEAFKISEVNVIVMIEAMS